ncbi:MAG: DNA polymerase III subunit beta [bacterium]|nr:DNA polymerase III subunit beta [bacterium]
MKFVILKNKLLDNLNYVSKALSSKTLIPVLMGIKFELNEKGLTLLASDTDISIQAFIDKKDIASINNAGSIVIQGKYIVEIIKKMPNTLIELEVVDNYNLVISAEDSNFNLHGMNPNEFPDLYMEKTKEPLVLSCNTLKEIINQTLFASSVDESRPILTGLNLKISNGVIDAIATDSYRLAKKEINIDIDSSVNINIVIPARNLLELCKIIGDEENLELHLFNNKILFHWENILFQSRLLSGKYPATSDIIPNDFAISLEVSYTKLYEMIDRVSLLTSEKDKNIINMKLNNGELNISSNSPEIGRALEKLDVDNDNSINISFSSKYMLDAIKSFGTEKILLLMNTDVTPIILKSEQDSSLTQLILPIKTY